MIIKLSNNIRFYSKKRV